MVSSFGAAVTRQLEIPISAEAC